jgi:alkylhydroperoxidase/carboxymuconolactone decarboxylase family protein YurZ
MTTAETARKGFSDFFEAAHTGGVLDWKTKELLHMAVVAALHCEP